MTVLVVGGTGNVGSRTARTLRDNGVRVRCLTRSPDKVVGLAPHTDGRVGDLTDPSSLAACFEGCEAAFIVLALSQTEYVQGNNAVRAAIDAGMKKIVFMSVVGAEGTDHIPHFGEKRLVEELLRDCGIPHVILRPNSFFQNELHSRVPLTEFGVFDTPFGHIGANRIDARDVADAATRVLMTEEYDDETFDLHGPEILTGPKMAEVWSRNLGKPITYTGDDLDGWERSIAPSLPDWLTRNLRLMYERIVDGGLVADDAAVALSRRVVGHPLRTYEAFVQETVARWQVR